MTAHTLRTIALGLVLTASVPAVAVAHTMLLGTSPKTGSVLQQSPAMVELTFRAAASLTSVTVVEGRTERRLAFTPVGSATVFKIQDPLLGPGRSEIHWKALSMDGHVISGIVVLTIDPAAAKTH